MYLSLPGRMTSVTALIFILLQALIEAQTNQSSGIYARSQSSLGYDSNASKSPTSTDVKVWTSSSTSQTPESTYPYKSTVRLLTTTNNEGQTQILAEITWIDPAASGLVDAPCVEPCVEPYSPDTTMSPTATQRPSGYVDPTSSTDHAAPRLIDTSLMRISIGAISGFLALVVGVFLVSTWRRRRKIRQMKSTYGSVVETSADRSKKLSSYEKPELHATERALYEMDGADAMREADGIEKMADGELEDKHASSIAREREGRSELPEDKERTSLRE